MFSRDMDFSTPHCRGEHSQTIAPQPLHYPPFLLLKTKMWCGNACIIGLRYCDFIPTQCSFLVFQPSCNTPERLQSHSKPGRANFHQCLSRFQIHEAVGFPATLRLILGRTRHHEWWACIDAALRRLPDRHSAAATTPHSPVSFFSTQIPTMVVSILPRVFCYAVASFLLFGLISNCRSLSLEGHLSKGPISSHLLTIPFSAYGTAATQWGLISW